jgi:hypothetical protein
MLDLREYVVPQVEDHKIVDMYTIFSFDYATRTDEFSEIISSSPHMSPMKPSEAVYAGSMSSSGNCSEIGI